MTIDLTAQKVTCECYTEYKYPNTTSNVVLWRRFAFKKGDICEMVIVHNHRKALSESDAYKKALAQFATRLIEQGHPSTICLVNPPKLTKLNNHPASKP